MCNYGKLDDVTIVQDVNTNKTCLYDLTPEQEKANCLISTYLEVYGQLIVCVSGLFFNSLTVLIFFNQKKLLSVFFNRLLLCLVIMDNVYLSITILDVWLLTNEHLYHDYALFYPMFCFVYPIKSIIACCTTYMIVMLALEKYNAISKPQNRRVQNLSVTEEETWLRVLKFVGTIVLICTLFKSPGFWEFNIEVIEDGRDINSQSLFNNSLVLATDEDKTTNTTTNLILSDMRRDKLYVLLYTNLANLIFTGLLPLALILYLNIHVYKGFRKFNERRTSMHQQNPQTRNRRPPTTIDNSQSIILFAIVFVFIICHTLRILLNVEDLIYHETRIEEIEKGCKYGTRYWALLAIPFSELLLRLNSSLNFFIYCAFNKSFRNVICTHISKMLKVCNIEQDNEESMANNYELQPLRRNQTV